ncbi:MAG TPA: UDP-N-acetylmuramoyl-L-alanyl-D-glutamate--2,6-diaminopimelate ligase, partial [Wenzhouxiangella sp.]|nr:UDP-N-acetylmuramoyl-L-alanyl-D-glutamate--2,6-diaminopimelate ligase [Wenzhouxiangella sp.]
MAGSYSMPLNRLLDGLAKLSDDVVVADLCLDSRHCGAGSAFVAMAGEQCHGLDHLPAALNSGAIAVIHDGARPLVDCPVPAVAVPDLVDHLPSLARRFFGSAEEMDLVAVTGTNGKTSVAWLLAQALDAAMLGTLGMGRPGAERPGTHTTPDILSVYRALATLRADGHRCVVMEASSHALDQRRLAGLKFSCAIFTGLGHDHLDYHASLEAYFAAKSRLFTEYESARQIFNLDDPYGRGLAERLAADGHVLSYSLQDRQDATARLRQLRADLSGLKAAVSLSAGDQTIESGLIGQVNLHNLAIVFLELRARGFSAADISQRLTGLEPPPGRMQVVDNGHGVHAVIDYAHTPDALELVLSSLRQLGAERLICLFGCGGQRDRAKRPMMGRIA